MFTDYPIDKQSSKQVILYTTVMLFKNTFTGCMLGLSLSPFLGDHLWNHMPIIFLCDWFISLYIKWHVNHSTFFKVQLIVGGLWIGKDGDRNRVMFDCTSNGKIYNTGLKKVQSYKTKNQIIVIISEPKTALHFKLWQLNSDN